MIFSREFAVAGVALLLASVAGAQVTANPNQGGKQSFRRYDKPLRTLTLDLESGELTRGPVVQDRAVTSCTVFPNTDLGGFVGVDTGSCACEWIDAGAKPAGCTNFLTDFTFAYCSASLDTLSGGVGGSAELFFREGYRAAGVALGTEIGRFCITGLPANTASSSFFGGFTCFFINITFGSIPLCFSDGAIGYGWKFKDVGTDGVLAATFPFLSCVQSCTGPGVDGLGMADFIDQYCPPGSLLSTFSFGTTAFGGYFTSISMGLNEAKPGLFGSTNTPDPEDTDYLSDIDSTSPTLSSTPFGFAIACPAPCTSGKVEVRAFPAAVGICGGGQTSLANKPRFIKFGGPPSFGLAIALPKDLSFACIPYSVMGFCFTCANGCTGADIILTNAFRETVGV